MHKKGLNGKDELAPSMLHILQYHLHDDLQLRGSSVFPASEFRPCAPFRCPAVWHQRVLMHLLVNVFMNGWHANAYASDRALSDSYASMDILHHLFGFMYDHVFRSHNLWADRIITPEGVLVEPRETQALMLYETDESEEDENEELHQSRISTTDEKLDAMKHTPATSCPTGSPGTQTVSSKSPTDDVKPQDEISEPLGKDLSPMGDSVLLKTDTSPQANDPKPLTKSCTLLPEIPPPPGFPPLMKDPESQAGGSKLFAGLKTAADTSGHPISGSSKSTRSGRAALWTDDRINEWRDIVWTRPPVKSVSEWHATCKPSELSLRRDEKNPWPLKKMWPNIFGAPSFSFNGVVPLATTCSIGPHVMSKLRWSPPGNEEVFYWASAKLAPTMTGRKGATALSESLWLPPFRLRRLQSDTALISRRNDSTGERIQR